MGRVGKHYFRKVYRGSKSGMVELAMFGNDVQAVTLADSHGGFLRFRGLSLVIQATLLHMMPTHVWGERKYYAHKRI